MVRGRADNEDEGWRPGKVDYGLWIAGCGLRGACETALRQIALGGAAAR